MIGFDRASPFQFVNLWYRQVIKLSDLYARTYDQF